MPPATALQLLREQLALAYGDERDDPVVDQLARFALAAIDGAFVPYASHRMAVAPGEAPPTRGQTMRARVARRAVQRAIARPVFKLVQPS